MPIVKLKIDVAGTVGDEAWHQIKQFDQLQSADFGPVCDFALFGAGTRARCRRGRLTLSRVLGGFLLYAHVDVRSSVHRRTFSNPRVGFPALLIARDETPFAGRILLGHRFWSRATLSW